MFDLPPLHEGDREPSVFDHIRSWAKDRNLIDGSDQKAQTVKLMEETGELASGVAKNNIARVSDSIGDCVVVLTIIAEQYGLTIEGCIDNAYNEIKDRKGRMIDGVFVKQEDLDSIDTEVDVYSTSEDNHPFREFLLAYPCYKEKLDVVLEKEQAGESEFALAFNPEEATYIQRFIEFMKHRGYMIVRDHDNLFHLKTKFKREINWDELAKEL